MDRELGIIDCTQLISDPMLSCGLLLAGCNSLGSQAVADGTLLDNDGVLTGLEILGIDLAERSWFSKARDTGTGQVRTNEGVAGLRQAFRLQELRLSLQLLARR
ncbi:MAG: hypothetical protein R3C56_09205 [Pirellulaceae bacterium]